jgi:hypothetical protein
MEKHKKDGLKIEYNWIIGGIIGAILFLILLQNKILRESLLASSFGITSICILVIYNISNIMILPESPIINIIDIILGSVPFIFSGIVLLCSKFVFVKHFRIIFIISLLLISLGISYGILPFGIEGSVISSEDAQLRSPYYIFSGLILTFTTMIIILRFILIKRNEHS